MKKITEELNKVALDEEKLAFLQETSKYLQVKSQGTGKQFWEDYMLSSTKDYTNDMDYYQVVTELKVRLYRLTDDSYLLQKEQLELEELRLQLEDLNGRADMTDSLKRRTDIERRKLMLEINRKEISIESKNIALEELFKEVQDFRALADKRRERGVLPFEEARYKDMQKRIDDRYVHHLLTGTPFSNPELGSYYKDGMIVATPGALKQLETIAASTTNEGFRHFIQQQIEKQQTFLEAHNTAVNAGLLENKEKEND